MVDSQSFTRNPQDMATECKVNAILGILKVELENVNFNRLKTMAYMIEAIIKTQTICLWRLCEVIDIRAKVMSINRRLQRFVSEVKFDQAQIAKFLLQVCKVEDEVYLIMDRTNWKLGETNINILMLALSFNGKGIPLFWKLMDKRGNSNLEERMELLTKFKNAFPKIKIAGLLADREFIGEDWFVELTKMQIPFCIRVRNNFLIQKRYRMQKIIALFRKLPITGVKLFRQKRKVLNVPLFIAGTKIRNNLNKVDYCIVVSNVNNENPLQEYWKRWQIENMFRNMKSSGFDLESTHVTKHDRLNNLLTLISIAYVWVVKIGDMIRSTMNSDEILVLVHRKISIFRLGLRHLRNALNSMKSKALKDYVKVGPMLEFGKNILSPLLE